MEAPLADNLYDPEFDLQCDIDALFEEENKSIANFHFVAEGVMITESNTHYLSNLLETEHQNAMKVVFALVTKNFKYYKTLITERKVYQNIKYTYVSAMYNRLWTLPNSFITKERTPTIRFSASSGGSIHNFPSFVFFYSHHINNTYLNFFLKHLQEEIREYADSLGEEKKEKVEETIDPVIGYMLSFLYSISGHTSIFQDMLHHQSAALCDSLLTTYFLVWYKMREILRAHPSVYKMSEKWTKILTFSQELSSAMIKYLHKGGAPVLEENYIRDIYGQYRKSISKQSDHKIIKDDVADFIREVRSRYNEEDMALQRENIDLYRPMLNVSARNFQIEFVYHLLEILDHDYKSNSKCNFEIVVSLYLSSRLSEIDDLSRSSSSIHHKSIRVQEGHTTYYSKFYNDRIIDILSIYGESFYLYLKENEDTLLRKSILSKAFDFIFNYIDIIPTYDPHHLREFILKITPEHTNIRIFNYIIDVITTGEINLFEFGSNAHIHVILAVTDYLHTVSKKKISVDSKIVKNIVHYFDILNQSMIELPGITRRANVLLSNKPTYDLINKEDQYTVLETLYLAIQRIRDRSDSESDFDKGTKDQMSHAENSICSFIFSMFDVRMLEIEIESSMDPCDNPVMHPLILGRDPELSLPYIEHMFKIVLEYSVTISFSLDINRSLKCLLQIIESRPDYHLQMNWANVLGAISIDAESLPGSKICLFRNVAIQYFQKNRIIRNLMQKKVEWYESRVKPAEMMELRRVAKKLSLRCQHCKHYWFKPDYREYHKVNSDPIISSFTHFYQTQWGSFGTYNPVPYLSVGGIREFTPPKMELVNLPVFYLCSECNVHYHDICYYGLIPTNKKRIKQCAVCDSKKFARYQFNASEMEILIYLRILGNLHLA
jgi:hypothetical protein